MKEERYFIQPGDEQIEFSLALTLEELKTLYGCVAQCYNDSYQEGYIVVPYEASLLKLEGVIKYLQAEHYNHPN